MVGVPRLARWVCGPSSRIGWPLPWRTRSQPMNFGPISRPMSKRGRGRRAGAEGDVAEEVEDPRDSQAVRRSRETSVFPARQRLDEGGKSDRVRSLDEHRVARPDRRAGERRWPPPRRAHAPISTCPAKRFRERRHLLADQDRIIDLRRLERLGERGVEIVAVRRPARASRRAPRCGGRRPSRRRAPSASPPSRRDWRCSFRRSAAPRRPSTAIRWRSPRPLRPPSSASARPAARDRRRPPRPPPARPAHWSPNARRAGAMVKLSCAPGRLRRHQRAALRAAHDIGGAHVRALAEAEGQDARRHAAAPPRSAGRDAGCRTG